jgi:hypothetical protein
VLDRWPAGARLERDAFTTVANWRGYGSIENDGVHYGQKAHSLRRFLELPQTTGERFALALAIHPDEIADLEALRAHGWELLDPRTVAGTPSAYAAFVRGSKGELGIAKSGYADSRSGWFSDRSACYLASGRPVLAQETGFSSFLPSGAGLFAFRSADDVVAAVEELRRDYDRHSRAAHAIAEEFLDSDRVLTRLLREVGASTAPARPTLHDAPDDALAAALGDGVTILRRRPSAYRSSAPVTELDAALPDGTVATILVKDLSRAALTERALRAKPEFLADPLREIETYRSVLARAGLGTPALYGAVVEPERDRYWLAIEKVAGVELYQIGELELWQQALRWLARMHDRFAGAELPRRLLRYDRAFLRLWLDRARSLSGLEGLERYDQAVERLVGLPRTLLHGELYASNILVAGERVCAVDWELAAVGPGVIDVAALTMGWGDAERRALTEAYRTELTDPRAAPEFERDLDCARLHLAVQWLGWSPEWSPPPEHAQDFRAEVRETAARLGL